MVDQGIRTRVQRLVGGNLRTEDLTRLFLFARDRSDGRESVREIGDFVAHHDERSKGLVTRSAREWFAIAGYQGKKLANPSAYGPQRLPPEAPAFFRATLRRLSNADLKRNLAITEKRARVILSQALQKLIENVDGTYDIGNVTVEEARLLQGLSDSLVVKPAFDHRQLTTELRDTLKSNSVLLKEELRAFDELHPVVGLFAASVMHRCWVVISDTRRCQLRLTLDRDGIHVMTEAPIDDGPVRLSSAVFEAALDPVRYCSPELLAMGILDCEVELGTAGILEKMA